MARFHKNLLGRRFGKLKVIRFVGVDKGGNAKWRCRCKCGTERTILALSLVKKDGTKSCGCIGYRKNLTHCPRGHRFTPENTYTTPGTTRRTCRTCKSVSEKKRQKQHNAYLREHPEQRLAYENNRRTRITKAGGSFTAVEWKNLCSKHKNKCVRCGKRRKLTADHVIPVSKGGSSNVTNIQPLCKPCNSKKKDKAIDFRN